MCSRGVSSAAGAAVKPAFSVGSANVSVPIRPRAAVEASMIRKALEADKAEVAPAVPAGEARVI